MFVDGLEWVLNVCETITFILCGCSGLKDWVCSARGEFYGVLATEDERGK